MTLSPIFRSEEAVRLLRERGILDRLGPALALQIAAVERGRGDLEHVVGERFRRGPGEISRGANDGGALAYLQDYFFLTLFLAIFEALGVERERLPFYAELNFCIMGTITAADNLFDDQEKTHLP